MLEYNLENKSVRFVSKYQTPFYSNFPTPGRYFPSTIQSVEFHSSGSSFLSIDAGNLRVWDTSVNSAPIASCKVGEDKIFTASWNNNSLIGCGGVDQALVILDNRIIGSRGSPVVWFKYKAHKGAVKSLNWSPFSDYWMLSSGDDSFNIWDIRNTIGPVAKIEGHNGSIETVIICLLIFLGLIF
jgi:WD40 repeat protein